MRLFDKFRVELAGNKAFAQLNLGVIGDAHNQAVVLDIGDGGINPAAGDDLVAGLQLGEHFFVGLLPLALGRNDQEPHAHKEQNDGQKLADAAWSCSLCHWKLRGNFDWNHIGVG